MEIWRNINGYEDLYQVSNLGRVKSLLRKTELFSKNKHKKYCRIQNEKILKQTLNTVNEYLYVTLYNKSKSLHYSVHRLVAMAFIDNPNDLPEVNHKDCIKTNNLSSNLEWVSEKGNRDHARLNGKLWSIGNPKLSIDDVIAIRTLFINNPISDTARMFGVKWHAIDNILKYKSWI